MCIENDPSWKEEHPHAGLQGMKTARSIALISYRNHDTYEHFQHGITDKTTSSPIDEQVYKAETYQKYQGEKLAKRFNAFSYYALSRGMDSHNVGRGRGSVKAALGLIKAKALVIGISTDLLFPIQEQVFIAEHIPNGKHTVIESLYGHDGFLLEYEQIEKAIREFVERL
jgi:homoserine O-acetyltransferase